MRMTATLMDQVEMLNRNTNRIMLAQNDCDFKIDAKEITSSISHCSGHDSRNLIDFIQEVQSVIDLQLAPEQKLLKSLLNKVHNELRIWWARAVQRFDDWSLLKPALLREFISPVSHNQLVNDLVRRTQRPDESFRSFISDILSKSKALDMNCSKEELILQIWTNLNYSTLIGLKDMPMPQSIDELHAVARRLEDYHHRLATAKTREESSKPSSAPVKRNFPKN